MRQPRRSRSRTLALLASVAFLLLGVGANGSARAQSNAPSDLASQFGGYKLSSRGNGFLLSFDSPGLLPVGSPLFGVGLPEAQATGSNGPSGYALASLAYPGSLIADLPAVIAQSGTSAPIPSYPIRQQSFFPAGPLEATQQIGTASMTAKTSDVSSDSVAQYSGADLQAFFNMGQVTVTSHTGIEEGQVVSRVRSEVTNVNILGVVTIASIVTDLVAVSNGKEASTDGFTQASGVKVLGLDATLDAAGLHVGPPPPGSTTTTKQPSPLDPILGGNDLSQLNSLLKPVADALSGLIVQVVGASGTVNDLLKDAGISMRVLEPTKSNSGGQAQRTANGVLIEINYNGKTAPLVSTLLAAVPSSQLPTDSLIPGVPLNTSPQALFNLLKETYVTDLALAPGDVGVQASEPYKATPFAGGKPSGASPARAATTGSPGFSTAAPRLGPGGGGGSGGGGGLGDALPISFGAEPLALLAAILAIVFTAGVFGLGAGRLADNVLAAASSSCPQGLEPPSATYSPPGGLP